MARLKKSSTQIVVIVCVVVVATLSLLCWIFRAPAYTFLRIPSGITGRWNTPFPLEDRTSPPMQDNLDRYLGLPPDPSLAPNMLSRLDIANNLGNRYFDPRTAAALLPTHVRPPIDSSYKQVGILSRTRENDDGHINASTDIVPLMGQQLTSDKWRYFTMLGGSLQTKLGVKNASGKPCTSELGCPELYSQDLVDVAGTGSKYSVDLYPDGTFFR